MRTWMQTFFCASANEFSSLRKCTKDLQLVKLTCGTAKGQGQRSSFMPSPSSETEETRVMPTYAASEQPHRKLGAPW